MNDNLSKNKYAVILLVAIFSASTSAIVSTDWTIMDLGHLSGTGYWI